MSTKYVLALDQGTTSSRAILFDNEQNIIAVQQREFEQIYPQQGWVEHNPMEIWSTQYGVMNEVVAQSGVPPSASPTSARPPSCGKRPPAAPSTMPSSGSAAAPPRWWTSWCSSPA